eukprot:1016505-Pyramimonas_sp.AAC.1
MSDLAKAEGETRSSLWKVCSSFWRMPIGRLEELADVPEAGDRGDVAELGALLDRGMRRSELLDAVPPLDCGTTPLVSKRGSRADEETE